MFLAGLKMLYAFNWVWETDRRRERERERVRHEDVCVCVSERERELRVYMSVLESERDHCCYLHNRQWLHVDTSCQPVSSFCTQLPGRKIFGFLATAGTAMDYLNNKLLHGTAIYPFTCVLVRVGVCVRVCVCVCACVCVRVRLSMRSTYAMYSMIPANGLCVMCKKYTLQNTWLQDNLTVWGWFQNRTVLCDNL